MSYKRFTTLCRGANTGIAPLGAQHTIEDRTYILVDLTM